MSTTKVSAAMRDAGAVVQVVNVETGTVSSGTTLTPFDDTAPGPVITEGQEVMTLAITPTSASNILHVDCVVQVNTSLIAACTIALYNTDVHATNALACVFETLSGASHGGNIFFRHRLTAPGTSATTFRVRCGLNSAGTFTFNGDGVNERHDGKLSSSITITEIQV
jgi:hypothetical protein